MTHRGGGGGDCSRVEGGGVCGEGRRCRLLNFSCLSEMCLGELSRVGGSVGGERNQDKL